MALANIGGPTANPWANSMIRSARPAPVAKSTAYAPTANQTIAGLLQQHIPVDQATAIAGGSLNQSQASPWQAYGGLSSSTPQGSTINGSVVAPHSPDISGPVGQAQNPASTLAPNLIDSFPGVANALSLEQQGFGQLDAGLKSARERAIINFGDPSLAQMAGFGLDPQAGAFAQQNYLSGNSTLSRLDKAHQLAQQAIVNRLAAHGILGSGDLGYLQGDENQNYGNGVYDAQQSVLGQLANLYSGYLSNRGNLEQGVNTARLSALNDYMANPDLYATLFGGGQNTDTSTTKAPTKTSTTTKASAPKNTAAGVLRSAVAAGGNATKAASKFVKGSF